MLTFQELLPRYDEIYLSYIFHPYEGDTFLSPFEKNFQITDILYRDEDFELRHYIRRQGAKS